MELPLKCQCGEISGKIINANPKQDQHVVCMCIDCQTFAHYLGREQDVLDQHGGSEIYQVTPNKIVLERGQDKVKMLRLSPKGAQRFYAGCCNTPMANAVGPKTSFTGVLANFIDIEPTERNRLLGPVDSYCMAKYAIGGAPENAHSKFPLQLLAKVMKKMIVGKLMGHHKPNSLYNLSTNRPICEEQLVDRSVRADIAAKIKQAIAAN